MVLLAGAQDSVDEREVRRVHADGVLKKPLEASRVIETVRPLLDAAAAARNEKIPQAATDDQRTELVRAAVTIALDAALPGLIEEITKNVLSVIEPRMNTNEHE